MATIVDIARRANVSHATVSRVLSGSPLVKPETAVRISRIASEMGYAPNAIARGLVQNNTKTIGVIIPRYHERLLP
jgi:LacI family transcriptional regulator